MNIGDVVEVRGVGGKACFNGRMDEIGAVVGDGYRLAGIPNVIFNEDELIHYETGYMKVGYFPKDTHLMAFRRDEPAEKIWASEGYLYWAALTDLEEYLRVLVKYDERELVPPEEVRNRFYEILTDNKVDLTKSE